MKFYIAALFSLILLSASPALAQKCIQQDAKTEFAKIKLDTPYEEYSGIGMGPARTSKGFEVFSIFAGGPAEKAGLKPADIVVEIDGEPVAGMAMEELVRRIKGDAGTAVDITVARKDTDEPVKIRITRGVINSAYQWYDGRYFRNAFRLAQHLAEQGMAEAQNTLGVIYEGGLELPKDPVQAASWYRKAADQGDKDAQYNLGMLYANGKGVEEDRKEALRWVQKSAEQNNWRAYLWLDTYLKEEAAAGRIPGDVFAWYRNMAEKGTHEAQYRLGLVYSNGFGIPPDDSEAAAWMRKAAAQGSWGALIWLEKSLRHNPTKTNFEEVEKLYRVLAEQGSAQGQQYLAKFVFQRRNYAESYHWIKLSNQENTSYPDEPHLSKREMLGEIENASTTAQLDSYRKAVYSWRPTGFSDLENKALEGDAAAAKQVEKFYSTRAVYNYAGPEYRERAFTDAIKWQRLLAEKGNASAQFELGKLYAEMKDKRGDEGAEHWYLKAASQGHGEAMEALGYLYYKGIDGKKDYDSALKWWTRAAETAHGWHPGSNLVHLLTAGEQLKPDYVTAYKWQIISKAYNGISEGEDILSPEHYALKDNKKISDKMNQENIAEAELNAQEWLLKKANNSDVRAQRALAKSYAMGFFGKRDLEEAYFWLSLAFQTEGKGFMNGGMRPAQIAMKLSVEQVAKAEKRLDDCLAAAVAPPVTP